MSIDWLPLIHSSLPLLLLSGGGLLLLLIVAFRRNESGLLWVVLTSLVVIAALLLTGQQWWNGGDRFAWAFDLIFLIVLFLTLYFSHDTLQRERLEKGEYYALLLIATAGLMLIAHAGDLLLLFLGLEIAALCSYILTGFRKGSPRSNEAALKYFILGSFASGFLLYGIALIYGLTGSTSLQVLSTFTAPLPADQMFLLSIAAAFLLIGIAFKIAAVPFHFWSPDVYEGAPTPVTSFMAAAIKAGGFAALLRLVLPLTHFQLPLMPIFWALSVLTMTVGNLSALRQTNIKRMLAYSSIAHAGYALVGVTAFLQDPSLVEGTLGAVVFYLFAYSMMTLGAFGVVIALSRRGKTLNEPEEIFEYASLAEHHPGLAAILAVFLLSLIGLPPTIGFVGKFYLFTGAMQAGLPGLVVVAVLNSVVSVYYYLSPIVKMYFLKGRGYDLPPLSRPLLIALFLCLFAVVYLGIFPSNLFLIAKESVKEILL